MVMGITSMANNKAMRNLPLFNLMDVKPNDSIRNKTIPNPRWNSSMAFSSGRKLMVQSVCLTDNSKQTEFCSLLARSDLFHHRALQVTQEGSTCRRHFVHSEEQLID